MSLPLARILVAAAVSLATSPLVVRDAVMVAPAAPVVAPAATQALVADDDLQARVEIGPAVLRIYDAKGNVIAVE